MGFFRRLQIEHGPYIGDLFMSLIHTCFLGKINPFAYLTTLQKNTSDLFANPLRWLPWNYQENVSKPCPKQIQKYPPRQLIESNSVELCMPAERTRFIVSILAVYFLSILEW